MLFNIEDKVYNRSLKNKIKVSLSIIYNKFLKLNDLNKTFEALNLAALNIFKKKTISHKSPYSILWMIEVSKIQVINYKMF